mmetsp:Transcript_20127/g.30268  ORF Transcript_20127/g.30268 Transcript_20127/m.30268 type:complete len:226 (-) Transcript_20127:760-1437(-)
MKNNFMQRSGAWIARRSRLPNYSCMYMKMHNVLFLTTTAQRANGILPGVMKLMATTFRVVFPLSLLSIHVYLVRRIKFQKHLINSMVIGMTTTTLVNMERNKMEMIMSMTPIRRTMGRFTCMRMTTLGVTMTLDTILQIMTMFSTDYLEKTSKHNSMLYQATSRNFLLIFGMMWTHSVVSMAIIMMLEIGTCVNKSKNMEFGVIQNVRRWMLTVSTNGQLPTLLC